MQILALMAQVQPYTSQYYEATRNVVKKPLDNNLLISSPNQHENRILSYIVFLFIKILREIVIVT